MKCAIKTIIGTISGILITIPKALAETTTVSFPQPTPAAPPFVQNVVQNVLNMLWWLALAAIVGMIIWSGITMLTSEDPRDQATARGRLIRVIIGAVIILGGLQIIKWLMGV
jgi:type IV secretory pathway VirB2 component (pilin)